MTTRDTGHLPAGNRRVARTPNPTHQPEEQQPMTDTNPPQADGLFVPPAADGLPLAALDSATQGADRLDAMARTPYGRNLLAHALVQLARDGWLRTACDPLPVSAPVSAPTEGVAEADADTVATRAAQVITSMGADIRALTSQRARYRSAWCNARERAQAYGEGILRVVGDREQWQEWLRQTEAAVEAQRLVLSQALGLGTGAPWDAIRDRAAELAAVSAPVPPAPADQTSLRDRIAEALMRWAERNNDPKYAAVRRSGTVTANAYGRADAVLAVLPEPINRAAIRAATLREAADRYATLADQNEAYDREHGDLDEAARIQHGTVRDVAIGLRGMADEIVAASGPGGVAGETPQPETQADLLPAWEAMYEPGNVSDYLIGYANDEAPAKAAAEAWLRSQAEVTGRLEWVPQRPLDGYDTEAELIERHDDGIDTGPGITIRRRVEPA